jgi:hypothetical protein
MVSPNEFPIQLTFSTGHQQVDEVICGMIGVFEMLFPNRIRCYYLVGSYVDDSATPVSDIDIRIIFKGAFEPGEEERMLQVRHYCRLMSPIALDCPLLSEERIWHDEKWLHEPLGIQSDGRLLFGEDIRHTFTEPDFGAYLENVTAVPVNRFARIRSQSPLVFPLNYPDPDGEFYGYDDWIGPDWAREASIKGLVHMVGFAATCLIGFQSGRMVTKKSEWLDIYKESINDEWTPLLEAIYTRCKEDWSYRIPDNEAERGYLRELCRQVLGFENYYLTQYRVFLQGKLEAGDGREQAFAQKRLKEIFYSATELRNTSTSES